MNTQIHRRKAAEQTHPLEDLAATALTLLNFIICCFAVYFMWRLAAPWRPIAVAVLVIPIYILSKIAWKIGEIFRNFTMPSAYFADGAKDAFNKKIFWIVGPQSIATFWTIVIAWYLGFLVLTPESIIKKINESPPAITSEISGDSEIKSSHGVESIKQIEPDNHAIPVEKSSNQSDSDGNIDNFNAIPAMDESPISQSEDLSESPLPFDSAGNFISPSFDCQKAASTQEQLICSNSQLAFLDVQLAAEYKNLLDLTFDKPSLKKSQIRWLTSTRKACKNIECLTVVYQVRISELQNMER